MRALLIPVAEDVYAIDMQWVREVVAAPLATKLPTGPGSALGVFNLRGEIVPLFDTALLLGQRAVGQAPFAVVVESSMGPAGLAATAAPESATLGDRLAATEASGSIATYAVGNRIATLLDIDALFVPANIGGWAG
jgi:purine-binding chemotaxis protein CheW